MGLLRKEGVETIDYTLLQKKGFIKKREEKKNNFKVDSHGMIDLTGATAAEANNVVQSSDTSSNPFGFLDSLAQSSGNTGQTGSFSDSATSGDSGNAEISAMKIKIDDLEYKLTQLVDKLSIIESKLGSFENKVLG